MPSFGAYGIYFCSRKQKHKNMAAHLFKRYVWLLEQISKGGKTFSDISRAWEYSPLNGLPGTPLPKRTFINHIEEIKEMFGLDIKCQRQGGYKYVLEDNEGVAKLSTTQKSLLNYLITSNLLMEQNPSKYVIIPQIDTSEYVLDIQLICDAISRQRKIKFLWGWIDGDSIMEDRWVELAPYYIKGYTNNNRKEQMVWYLFGVGSRGCIQIYDLKHIKEIAILDESFEHPHTPFEEIEHKAFHTPISQTDDDDSFGACIDSRQSLNSL